MGATSSIVTGNMDLQRKDLSYETLYALLNKQSSAQAHSLKSLSNCLTVNHPCPLLCWIILTCYWRNVCSEQHLSIVGDKALVRVKQLGLCRNKLSALPPRIKVMNSLVEIRCTDNWLKYLPEVWTIT